MPRWLLFKVKPSDPVDSCIVSHALIVWDQGWILLEVAARGQQPNIEDGSSLIIHWSSGSHKRSTNWATNTNTNTNGDL